MRWAAMFFFLTLCFSQSLWNESNSSVYGPPIAHAVGDIVLIRINENSVASQKAQTDLKKNTNINGNISWGQMASALASGQGAYAEGNSFSGMGTTGRSNSLRATIMAQIYKVENDRLYIRGSKRIIINNEEDEVTLEGIIRNQDVQADNSILSSLIAEAVLKAKGYGSAMAAQEKGFIPRLFEWLF